MRENKLLMLIASAIIVATAMFASSSAKAQTSGTCGDNATWTYDEDTKTLTISGTGAMSDYSSANAPWWNLRDNIQSVIIESGITHIGDYSFYLYKSLESVTIPEGVTSIGKNVFTSCDNLKSVTIPNSTKSIGEKAFASCYALGKITIPNTVETIGTNAFRYAKYIAYSGNAEGAPWGALTPLNGFIDANNGLVYEDDTKTKLTAYLGEGGDINIPDGVISIGKRAFYKTDITSVNIPGSVESIGESAFEGTGLSSVTIPGSVKTIESAAFASCENLESVILTEGIETLGSSAFLMCGLLQSIIIPASVTKIGRTCFSGYPDFSVPIDIIICYANPELITFGDLAPLNVNVLCVPSNYYNKWVELSPNGVQSIASAFSIINGVAYCANDAGKVYASTLFSNAPADITIESKITINNAEYDVIGVAEELFQSKNFNSVTISEGVTSIGDWAFNVCHLSSLTIPESVTTIGENALRDAKIPDIYCYANPNNTNVNLSKIYNPTQFHVSAKYLDKWNELDYDANYVTIVGDIFDMGEECITIPSQTYTGSALTPIVKNGDKTLVEGEDYTITLPQGGCTNAGEYTVALQGKKFYYKKAEKTFTIIQATPTYTIPENLSLKCNQTLADITLPKGLVFDDIKAALTLGKTNTVTATFTPEDTKNYVVVKGIEIKVAVADHVHAEAVKENEVAATTENAGKYDEVVYCSVCHKELSRTPKTTPQLTHDNPNNQDNPSTPVSSISDNPVVKVWSFNHTIYIETLPDTEYKIIDLNGRVITTSKTKSTNEQIKINKSGILIVIIDNQSFKLSL